MHKRGRIIHVRRLVLHRMGDGSGASIGVMVIVMIVCGGMVIRHCCFALLELCLKLLLYLLHRLHLSFELIILLEIFGELHLSRLLFSLHRLYLLVHARLYLTLLLANLML